MPQDSGRPTDNPFYEKAMERIRSLPPDGFAEVYIESGAEAERASAPQKLTPPDPDADERRRVFTEMRYLLGGGGMLRPSHAGAQALSFYKQAKYMERFEDHYEGNAAFNMYFPDYQRMGYAQLRTYFTWRTEARRGIVRETSLSYVFLYFYELLNNVGVTDCQDGLSKLLSLWEAYRPFEPKLDRYLPGWIKDYYITNDFAVPFALLVQEHSLLREFFPPAEAADRFSQYEPLAKYRFEKSSFYSPERMGVLRGCFEHVVEAVSGWMEENGAHFDELVYFSHRGSPWAPFPKALYHLPPAQRKQSKTVRISDQEIYWLENGQWLSSQNRVCKENGRLLIEYLLRRIEQFYRRAAKFKYKLTADRTRLSIPELASLPGGEEAFFARIDQAVVEHYRASQRKPVTVDPQRLEQIRANALLTQEKLLAVSPDEREQAAEENEPAAPQPEDGARSGTREAEGPPPAPPAAGQEGDAWVRFARSLLPVERQAVALLLRGASLSALHALARENRLMLEVLVDNLNEKAIDTVEDNVVELSETVTVFEDYRGELERVIFDETV